ncbi:unnamed protein product [Ilex paraguariensis]|uniref:Uncharacterized protein n=1 Tax=Ilex paraguariensis TaxID=185542 RepID=A0ABC8UXL7_9AQUA
MMSLASRSNLIHLSERKNIWGRNPLDSCLPRPVIVRAQKNAAKNVASSERGQIARISKMFDKAELSISSYDTAWVAMVPSRDCPQSPCFPECLDWVLQNQHPDGSWCLLPNHPLLIKDSLSSTLACIVALQKWKVGELLVKRGLDFIRSNSWSANDKNQYSPMGFNVIFPGMIKYAKDLELNLPLDSTFVDTMHHKQDLEIKANRGRLDYFAEGFGESYNWKNAMIHQRSNGSLFNSPATTAAGLIHLHDHKSFEYLQKILEVYKNAVPTIYPLDIYSGLCMVDRFVRLGIDRYFKNEIESILHETYRCWIQRSEEILLDITTCAMAFRLLRMNGYEISSDTNTILELYKASQIKISQEEPILDKIGVWTSSFLKKQVRSQTIEDPRLHKEVEYALQHPLGYLDRLDKRRTIEQYDIDNLQLLKTSCSGSTFYNRDLWSFSLQDFNICQAIQRKELRELERWGEVTGLGGLKFARQRIASCYFCIAATLFSPELSDARSCWAKNASLATFVDDFFDVGATKEEMLNLIELVQRWDGLSTAVYCSENVEILYSALHDTINELAAKALIQQGRCVKHHLIEVWLDFLKCMMQEDEWVRSKSATTLEEYLPNGRISIALGPTVLTTQYFLGSALSEEIVRSAEYGSLFLHMGCTARLFNDLQTSKRESEQGKLNYLSLLVLHSRGEITEDDAMETVRGIIESHRRQLLSMVVQTKGSKVPKPCKDMFWETTQVLRYFYMSSDDYTSTSKTIGDIKAVIHDQLSLAPCLS